MLETPTILIPDIQTRNFRISLRGFEFAHYFEFVWETDCKSYYTIELMESRIRQFN